MARVLLINPPFALPDKPGLALPVLSAWLRGRGHEVHCLDANLELWRRLLSPEELARRGRWLKARLRELDSLPRLGRRQALEYLSLRRIALEAEKLLEGAVARPVFDPRPGPGFSQRVEHFRLAALVAGAPHFPQQLDFQESQAQPRLRLGLSPYSSADLAAGRDRDDFFGGHYRELVHGRVRELRPQVVGVSALFPDQLIAALAAARWAKQAWPRAWVVLGGSMVSSHLRRPPHPGLWDHLDALVLDDGESALEALARQAASPRPEMESVPGLVRLQGGKLRAAPPAQPVPLARQPLPDFSGLPLADYLPPRAETALPFRLSRGCAWARCAFCNTGLPCIHLRDQRPAQRAQAHLAALYEQTGMSIIHLTDDSAPPLLLEELGRLLAKRGPELRLVASMRIEPELTLGRCLVLRRAGLRAAYLGLETLSPEVSRRMNKGINLKLVPEVLLNLNLAGIMTVLYMMVGFPGESEEQAREGFEQVMEWKRRGLVHAAQYSLFEIAPHSLVAADPGRFGVSAIRRPPGQDLGPPLHDFQTPGMSRQRAAQLAREFSRALRPAAPPAPPRDPQVIRLEGREMRLKHPVEQLRHRIGMVQR